MVNQSWSVTSSGFFFICQHFTQSDFATKGVACLQPQLKCHETVKSLILYQIDPLRDYHWLGVFEKYTQTDILQKF